MPCRTWMFIIALGLAFSATLLKAQEETQGGAGEQHQSPQILPIPIPVQIVEDDESAEARQRGEAETRQREIDDLEAQQGMNVATQAMNDATQSMKNAAWWTFGAVTLGTALLVWTLILTRQANEAAQRAVSVTQRIGEAQVRAYVNVDRAEVTGFSKNGRIRFYVVFKNTGSTPAKNFSISCTIGFYIGSIREMKISGLHLIDSKSGTVGAGGRAFIDITMPEPLTDQEYEDIRLGAKSFVIAGYVSYSTVFGNTKRTVFKMTNVAWSNPNVPIIGPCGKNNRSS